MIDMTLMSSQGGKTSTQKMIRVNTVCHSSSKFLHIGCKMDFIASMVRHQNIEMHISKRDHCNLLVSALS